MPNRYVQPLRILVQSVFIAITIWTGYRFAIFLKSSIAGGNSNHPDAVEAFLPISGLFGSAALFKGGGINLIHPAAVIFFLTIIALSLILRRSFCSWICPIGTISEIFWKTGYKLFKRNLALQKYLDVALRGIKYIILFFFLYSAIFAMALEELQAFLHSDFHKVADARLYYLFANISTLSLTVISIIAISSIPLKNPFCRYLCPYGALLGLISIFSPTRVTRSLDRCVSCGVCSQLCPSRIDVMHKKSVVSPECIGCWRCVSHCRFNQALQMKFAGKFIFNGVIFALLLLLIFRGGIEIGKTAGFFKSSVTSADYRR